jgi:hypothetical protein
MRFDSDNIWNGIEAIDISDGIPDTDSIFRFCLDDFVYIWEGFASRNPAEKRGRLSDIFNIDYFDSCTVVTDSISLEKLANAGFYDSSPKDGS